MQVVNSYTSFPTITFTSILEPYTPIYTFSAPREGGLTSGQALGNGIAPFCDGYKANVTTVTYQIDGTGRKYANVPVVASLLKNAQPSKTANYGTNGGSTTILIARFPTRTSGTAEIPAYSSLFDWKLYDATGSTYMVAVDNTYTAGQITTAMGTGQTFGNFSSQFGKFAMWVTVVNGTTMSNYMNNVLQGTGTVTALSNRTTTNGNDYNFMNPLQGSADYMYYAHYDRPFTGSDLANVYNSVSMLLG